MSLPHSISMRGPGGTKIEVPSPGYGTYTEGDTSHFSDTIALALRAGYRHLDCAWEYGVNSHIRTALAKAGIPRSEIFITSKLWLNFHRPEYVELCMNNILEECGLEYVDLFLIHHPLALKPALPDAIRSASNFPGASPIQQGFATDEDGNFIIDTAYCTRRIATMNNMEGSILPTWQAMAQLVQKGKARAIGVSNFYIEDLEEILLDPSYDSTDAPISCNQIEMHPWCPFDELLTFMKEQSILPVAYSPFAAWHPMVDPSSGKEHVKPFRPDPNGLALLEHPVVLEIAARMALGPGQVLQSWLMQRQVVPLGRSRSEKRLRENQNLRYLDAEDTRLLDGLKLDGLSGKSVKLSNLFSTFKCD